MRLRDSALLLLAAALGACDPTPADLSPVAESFIVTTTDPLWTAHVKGREIALKNPEDTRIFALQTNQAMATGRRVLARDAAGRLEIQVTAQRCEDDASGAVFPYSATLAIDGAAAVTGCARPASNAPPAVPQ